MGEIKTYFLDSYAFFEIINGNPEYEKFTKGVSIITTKLNLMELHYGLVLILGKEKADEIYDHFSKFAIDIDDETIRLASYFKNIMKSKNLTFTDCIGYVLSKSRNIPFLTGDEEFKDLENVEFVK